MKGSYKSDSLKENIQYSNTEFKLMEELVKVMSTIHPDIDFVTETELIDD